MSFILLSPYVQQPFTKLCALCNLCVIEVRQALKNVMSSWAQRCDQHAPYIDPVCKTSRLMQSVHVSGRRRDTRGTPIRGGHHDVYACALIGGPGPAPTHGAGPEDRCTKTGTNINTFKGHTYIIQLGASPKPAGASSTASGQGSTRNMAKAMALSLIHI